MHEEGPAVRDPRWVFAATAVGVVAVFLNMSGLAVALPTITRELGAGPGQADWILLGYMLVTTALILVFGRIADLVGRRRLYLAGLVVFTVATGLAALSPSAEFLIAARVVQGVGAAAVIANNTALLTDVFPARTLGRALGWNVTVAALAQIAGPVVGGAATELLGWHGLFVVCVPIGLLAIGASALVVPASGGGTARRAGGVREPFDLPGALLSTAMLTALVLALTPGTTATVAGWLPWVCGGATLALFTAFAVVQARRSHPLVDVALLRTRAITLVLVAVLANAVGSYAVVLLASLHEQAVTGATSLEAGVLVTPVAVGTLMTSVVAGSLFDRFTPRALTTAGMAMTACGLLGFSLTLSTTAVPFLAAAPFLFLVGAGTGLFMTPSTSALMLSAPADRRGMANGLRSTTQNVGYLLSTALALAVTTTGLSEPARRAAYDGTLNTLNVLASGELNRFVANIRATGFVLTGIVVAGGAICLAFPTSLRAPRTTDAVAANAPPESATSRRTSP
ncbi:MFS transporter [Streptomyces pseudovenezuelae]|uniref:EmrB/QacA subfamily drug resistance transporter n=1 Tax=Streptomyces pseudovenezuelae TaxID=67350 RepID=A0ABT6LCJ8_9ACTN|nr:MFS transporter [Streptomyces pseudovenezuelae]MDH6213529.1 EmrB/QacA subfamily drug resistance transporter [Streptomyces pseudovenezuelae]